MFKPRKNSSSKHLNMHVVYKGKANQSKGIQEKLLPMGVIAGLPEEATSMYKVH